jgi:DNA-binding IscR family transcriptional regulator
MDREKEQRELLASLQQQMNQRVSELQKSLERTTQQLREATTPKAPQKTVRPEVRIRTLRGTYGGLVLVRPAESASLAEFNKPLKEQ